MCNKNYKVLSAALFDLDGTLVDTMPMHYEAYRDVLSELGISIDFDFFMSVSGGPARETIPKLIGAVKIDTPTHEVHLRKQLRMDQLLSQKAPETLPCSILLHRFAEMLPVGLVSSGSRKSVESTLNSLGWRDLFQVIITGDDVKKGKPAPEGYLAAARFLDVEPSNCLVFEDMEEGILAATSAGMQVFDLRKALPVWRTGLREGGR